MFSRLIFWPWFAGLIFLLAGCFIRARSLAASRGLDKLIVLGPVFFAAPLAVFGAEHLVSARFIMQIVPAWMPGRLFWAYFVGVALLSGATSLVLMKQVRLSSTLLSVMFFLFVLLIHIPNVAAKPGDRFLWAVALRDLSFAGGACALAGSLTNGASARRRLILIGRLCIAIAVLFFAVQHFLHPEFAPGVPLSKMTPAWVPIRPFWGYLTGTILLIGGAALLINKKGRTAAASIGLLATLLTLLLYVPILALASQPQMIEAINYVFDTLLFAGTALLLAGALPADLPRSSRPSSIESAGVPDAKNN